MFWVLVSLWPVLVCLLWRVGVLLRSMVLGVMVVGLRVGFGILDGFLGWWVWIVVLWCDRLVNSVGTCALSWI